MPTEATRRSLAPARALEEKLRADPEDGESWLVYADYLIDQGDARGEWIAFQHRLASRDLRLDERRALQRQIQAIDGPNREALWLAGYRALKGTEYTWRCGFVIGVKIPWKKTTISRFEALMRHPSARFLATLDLSHQRINDEGVERLVASKAFARLHTLTLYNNNIRDRGARTLASAGSHLRVLDLQRNRIGDAGALALAQSPPLSGLTLLHLWDNYIGERGQAALATSETLRTCSVYAKRQQAG